MNKRLRFIATFAATSALIAVTTASLAQSDSCRSSPLLVGQCFTVHGRLSIANGSPGVRIWRVGTKRMLGVMDGQGHPLFDLTYLPPEIRKLIPADVDRTAIYGDYTVCPFTRERAGWMPSVCIADATHLVAGSGP
jgi:hypothetical protein